MQTPDQYNANLTLQEYVVAFIDILGQGKALRKLRNSEWWLFKPDTEKLLLETYGSVQRCRDLFRNFQIDFSKPSPIGQQFLDSNPTEEDLALWKAIFANDLQVFCVSDSIIALIQMRFKDGVFPFASVFNMMWACCNTILTSLCERRSIRGSIAIGPCVLNSEINEVYGSAISEAVRLEKSANWPRLLVDLEIVRRLKAFAEYSGSEKVERQNAAFAQRCLNLVVEDDEDGKLILDYLGPGIRQCHDIPVQLYDAAEEFILSQLSKYTGKEKILDKYKKVQKYFRKYKIQSKVWPDLNQVIKNEEVDFPALFKEGRGVL